MSKTFPNGKEFFRQSLRFTMFLMRKFTHHGLIGLDDFLDLGNPFFDEGCEFGLVWPGRREFLCGDEVAIVYDDFGERWVLVDFGVEAVG